MRLVARLSVSRLSVSLLGAALFAFAITPARALAQDDSGESAESADGSAAPPAPSVPSAAEVDSILAELDAMVARLGDVRSRVANVGRRVVESGIRVRLRHRGELPVRRVEVHFDGVRVYQGGRDQEELHQVFDGFAAPGVHTLRVVLEGEGARVEERYAVRVGVGKRTEVEIVLESELEEGDFRTRRALQSELQVEAVSLTDEE